MVRVKIQELESKLEGIKFDVNVEFKKRTVKVSLMTPCYIIEKQCVSSGFIGIAGEYVEFETGSAISRLIKKIEKVVGEITDEEEEVERALGL